LENDKGQMEALPAFLKGWRMAQQQGFRGSFYIVGGGSQEQKVKDKIREEGLDGSVHLWTARHKVADLYQAADVFVLPTLSEGLSNALLEAMACGLPVLASRVSGIQNIVKDQVNGHLFEPKHPEEVASLLRRIMKNPKGLVEMGRASLRLAGDYSIDSVANRYLNLYRSGVKKRGKPWSR
jgi:glycosyltransferase involved in cell wall biosynthesis